MIRTKKTIYQLYRNKKEYTCGKIRKELSLKSNQQAFYLFIKEMCSNIDLSLNDNNVANHNVLKNMLAGINKIVDQEVREDSRDIVLVEKSLKHLTNIINNPKNKNKIAYPILIELKKELEKILNELATYENEKETNEGLTVLYQTTLRNHFNNFQEIETLPISFNPKTNAHIISDVINEWTKYLFTNPTPQTAEEFYQLIKLFIFSQHSKSATHDLLTNAKIKLIKFRQQPFDPEVKYYLNLILEELNVLGKKEEKSSEQPQITKPKNVDVDKILHAAHNLPREYYLDNQIIVGLIEEISHLKYSNGSDIQKIINLITETENYIIAFKKGANLDQKTHNHYKEILKQLVIIKKEYKVKEKEHYKLNDNSIDDIYEDVQRKYNMPSPYILSKPIITSTEDVIDHRNQATITIDTRKSPDRDDALYIETDDNGDFILYVHITNVDRIMKDNIELKKSALERTATNYNLREMEHMLPKEYATDICSLMEGQEREVYTYKFRISKEGSIKEFLMYRSLIHIQKGFSFKEANKELAGSFELNYLLTLKKLKELTTVLTKKDNVDSFTMIETCALLVNHKVAEYFYENKYPMIYCPYSDTPNEKDIRTQATSPIRRYCDVLVEELIRQFVFEQHIDDETFYHYEEEIKETSKIITINSKRNEDYNKELNFRLVQFWKKKRKRY